MSAARGCKPVATRTPTACSRARRRAQADACGRGSRGTCAFGHARFRRMRDAPIHIVGGGLAGSEAAWQLAERGHDVVLHEMRPVRETPAHRTDRLAELVCSNTFKSTETTNAHGLLKAEMRSLGSMILEAADEARVPGGSALTVDRDRFAAAVDLRVRSHAHISVTAGEVVELPSPGIVATGPLTSEALTRVIQQRVGVDALAFYDAIAPIVEGDSID